MTQFINSTDHLVTDALDGLLRTHRLSRLDGYPHIKVIFRRDTGNASVALVSGGGSGHEPAHAGFVAEGLLSAAVCGEVFASPSVEAVLAGILAVTGDAGCLLIVKNYTGDRLNFGLAAERAKALGRKVEMVVVGDDVALPDLPQPRGVAGTLFVHKIAGHLASQGASLATVASAARAVAKAARSYGVALDNCTVPGSSKDARVPTGKAELGLGIHGEPGVQMIDFTTATSVCTVLMDKLGESLDGGTGQVMLLNNLGGATPLEMQILLKTLLDTASGQHIRAVIGPAPMMTSLDMHGFSVSLLPAQEEWMQALESPVNCAAWPGSHRVGAIDVQPLPEGLRTTPGDSSHDESVSGLIADSCAAFLAMQDDLNALDARTGDGDTGSTVAQAARNLHAVIGKLPLADPPALLRAISDQLSVSMGGSSGVLLAILFSAASDAARAGDDTLTALREGVRRMMTYGGASLGDRTMIDALVPALDELLDSGSLQQAAQAARKGADATARMSRARSGRSTYVPAASLQGVIDPGAEAVARYFAMLAARNTSQ
ncbi:MAG: DAK2 domain-containing protein [Granulosicoccus sp.]|nr:DAK2 domain-containing protein [Granulosicoccus sp.]